MSRRTNIFEDVVSLPWPVGVVASAVSFAVMQYVLANPPDGIAGTVITSAIKPVGWFFTLMFLCAGLSSFLVQFIRHRRFKSTHSIADIRGLSWKQFESYVGEMFREQGYFVLETPEGPDSGVDLVLHKDGEKTYVQCKHWKTNQVGVEKVRELLGSMAAGGAQSGIFVASGTYTQPAKDFARECGIRLIDGSALAASLNATSGSTESTAETVETVTVTCPVCQSAMVKRTARKGAKAGSEFWGCSKYPTCRGIRNI